MDEKNKILLLRISYWIGAILDGLFALDMSYVALVGANSILTNIFTRNELLSGGLPYRYALGIAAGLMWGWTFLLLWADRRPVERKFVLPLTVFPVVIGLLGNNVFAVLNGLVEFERMLLKILTQCCLIIIFLFSYLNARELKNS
ncbi:MAG: hypothetical protein ACW964_06355 [Candidatus Hodarchaeales archaeon]|jgi:hypothetical protein